MVVLYGSIVFYGRVMVVFYGLNMVGDGSGMVGAHAE